MWKLIQFVRQQEGYIAETKNTPTYWIKRKFHPEFIKSRQFKNNRG